MARQEMKEKEIREVQIHLAAAAYVRAIRRCESLGIEVVDWANQGEQITEIEIKDFHGADGDRRRFFL
jgi:hypothetical protein